MSEDKERDVIQRQEDDPGARSESDHTQLTSKPTDLGSPGVVNASSADGRDPAEGTDQALVVSTNLPDSVLSKVAVFMGRDGHAYLVILGRKNLLAFRIGSRKANQVIRRLARQADRHLTNADLREINEELIAHAELSDDIRDVWYRVAPIEGGIEIDVGDSEHTRIRVRYGKVEVINEGSDILFYRTPGMQPFVIPADDGDLKLLDRYLNLNPVSIMLMKAWLSFTLAHPKISTTSFVILVLQGDQGSGKTFLCRIIQDLVDPSIVGVQTFPRNHKDLVIAAQHAHALFYDNMRDIKQLMSDTLCTASTGGALSTRQLYTDAEQHVHWLHVALVLNGIHSFVDQSDLAQRCLPMRLRSIDEKDRRSESTMNRDFQADLPRIFRGLLDLIADIMTHLPTVEPTNPERMFDFSHWLAAMEKVDGAPNGAYQDQYSEALKEGMLDSLMENPLASAVMSFFAENVDATWSGKPSELLLKLNSLVGNRSRYSRDWPQTASALSKRLKPLQAGLRRQGIEIVFGRGKHRNITITDPEAF